MITNHLGSNHGGGILPFSHFPTTFVKLAKHFSDKRDFKFWYHSAVENNLGSIYLKSSLLFPT